MEYVLLVTIIADLVANAVVLRELTRVWKELKK
jgi:hypothetical protein